MIEIKSLNELDALSEPIANHLRTRFTQSYPQGRDDHDGYFVVVETTDTVEMLTMRYQIHFNEARHEFVDHHAGFYEALFLMGDDGFGIDLVIPDNDMMDMELIRYCQQHTSTMQSSSPSE